MKLVCVNNLTRTGNKTIPGLTLGKTYNADLMSNYLKGNYVYRILDDYNQLVWYNDEVFMLLEKYRDIKLNQLI
jgi:hypothetical protein